MIKMIPFRENPVTKDSAVETFDTLLDRIFDSGQAPWAGQVAGFGDWTPALDVFDAKEALTVKVDMPGMEKDAIEVQVEGDNLVIRGSRKAESRQEGQGVVRSERSYGSFCRSLVLPSSVDAGACKAAYKNGVLELTLPKKEEAKPRQVRIE